MCEGGAEGLEALQVNLQLESATSPVCWMHEKGLMVERNEEPPC